MSWLSAILVIKQCSSFPVHGESVVSHSCLTSHGGRCLLSALIYTFMVSWHTDLNNITVIHIDALLNLTNMDIFFWIWPKQAISEFDRYGHPLENDLYGCFFWFRTYLEYLLDLTYLDIFLYLTIFEMWLSQANKVPGNRSILHIIFWYAIFFFIGLVWFTYWYTYKQAYIKMIKSIAAQKKKNYKMTKKCKVY